MNRPGRGEIRTFGGSMLTLSVILWITYATALGNNGKNHYLPHWTLFLAWSGLVAGAVIVLGTIFWPSKPRPPRNDHP
jgi:hypothetical protein